MSETPTTGTAEDQLNDLLERRWAPGHARNIDCGPGWHGLIARLDSDLALLCPEYRVTRIRVRDGRLRYEIHPVGLPAHDPERGKRLLAIRHLISRYETESGTVCEQTGGPGRLHRRGVQLRTLADHAQADGWEPVTV